MTDLKAIEAAVDALDVASFNYGFRFENNGAPDYEVVEMQARTALLTLIEGVCRERDAEKAAHLRTVGTAAHEAEQRDIAEADLAAARDELARMREALRRYGIHSSGCPSWQRMYRAEEACTCGLEAALKGGQP